MYLLQVWNFQEVRKPPLCRYARDVDVVLIQEVVRPRHMWRKAIVEGLQVGRDYKVRTVILRNPEVSKFSRPVHLVFPLHVDQGVEDVEE